MFHSNQELAHYALTVTRHFVRMDVLSGRRFVRAAFDILSRHFAPFYSFLLPFAHFCPSLLFFALFCPLFLLFACFFYLNNTWAQGIKGYAYSIPGGQEVSLPVPRGSRDRPTGSQWFQGKVRRKMGGIFYCLSPDDQDSLG